MNPVVVLRVFASSRFVCRELRSHSLGSNGAHMATKNLAQVVGQVEEVARLLNSIVQFSTSRIPVLLLGPKSTGIDLLARCVHTCSPREARPFLEVHCATGSGSTEAQLVGARAKRGSHRGNGHPAGHFHAANGGTLFVEQIQNASPHTQMEILRVLTEGEYLDAEGKSHRIDVRVVASGWHDLEERVQEGRFRGDLYERLSRVTLQLRKGSSDSGYLLQVVELFRGKSGGEMSLEAMREHQWSDEILTLKMALHEADIALGENAPPEQVLLHTLRTLGHQNAQTVAQQNVQLASAAVERCLETYEAFEGHLYEKLLSQLQRTLIERAMIQCNGTLSRAAAMLGINTNLLEMKMRELGLN